MTNENRDHIHLLIQILSRYHKHHNISQLKNELNIPEISTLLEHDKLYRVSVFRDKLNNPDIESLNISRLINEQCAGLTAQLDEDTQTRAMRSSLGITAHPINQLRNDNHNRIVSHYDRAVGTGVGNKTVEGIDTGRPALIVFVTEKDRGFHKQDASQVIPNKIGGTEVDIVEVGDIKKQNYTAKARPITPGYSIGHQTVSAGTLGGIFNDRTGDIVVLSCNHVLADENRCKIGDLIFQPGLADQPNANRNFMGWTSIQNLPYFATLKDYEHISTNQKNAQDSAIAAVDKSYILEHMVTPNYPSGQPLTGIGAPTVGLNVQKFGRTTGTTKGRIIALNAEFTIGYDIGSITFTGCVVTTGMSQGGDSGALLLDQDMKAVALLFAGSDKVSLFNPIAPIIDKYGLRIWIDNNHNG